MKGISEKASEDSSDCSFRCLACHISPCPYDDPGMGKGLEVKIPQFEDWQRHHRKLMCKDPGVTDVKRCPRCYSLEVLIKYPNVVCEHCGFAEPLVDYPISETYRGALEEMYSEPFRR